MTRLLAGAPAPMFHAECLINPRFAMSSMGGRYVLLAFPPADTAGQAIVEQAIASVRNLLDDDNVSAFVVLADRDDYSGRLNGRGLRWFMDGDGEIGRLYGPETPAWVLMDPTLRILATARLEETSRFVALLRGLPPADRHAGTEVVAPVLIAPRVLEPDFCRRLIDHYASQGGAPSGTMRQVGGKTIGVLSDFKKRRDADIVDLALQGELRGRVRLRLLPEIEKAFQFKATRIERYIVACYDADSGGYFRPHRDNTTTGTAHRQFAVSINLNDDFEGGDLRFPEFGARTYRPPLGGAVVFSCSLLHEATAVTRGTRYATLPFLYDEAAAAVRAANLHTLEATASAAE